MRLTPGTRLGPYDIISPLGRGGMGEVYRAHDARLGRDVAIKVLPSEVAADPERVRRFENEARAIAALNHPHICQIHDIGPGYLVLEYIEGAPLSGPMPPAEAIRLALQVADALHAAHRKGILHRDLKPANILVTRDGRAKVLDFGLAQFVTSEHDTTRSVDARVAGTAAYMSPEQAQGQVVDARSDVFSLGAVLYEMLAGARAFAGDTAANIFSALLRDDPPPLRVPFDLERTVRRCLAKQPDNRFASMHDLKAALEALTADAPGMRSSIAVLPFENMSGDRENEYFSDGLSEEIINLLAQVPDLKVIARTSAFAFKGRHEDVRHIATTLGVAHVLEGSVRRAGNRIRVTAQLITATDGSHRWSGRYDRELADVFAVQDDIAAAITHALTVTLAGTITPQRRRHTPNLQAYDHYLKALYDGQRRTPESMTSAQRHLETAIAIDAQFALAHAQLGHLFLQFGLYGIVPPRDALPLVQREAQRALAIDASVPEGHALLGTAAAVFDFDWRGAERHFRQALGYGVVTPFVHWSYALYCLVPTGRADEAVVHYTQGLNDDPLNLMARGERAVCLRAASRFAEANDELRHILALDPTLPFPYFVLGVNLALEGQRDEARRYAEDGFAIAPWFKPMVGCLAALLTLTGETDRGEALLRQHFSAEQGWVDPIGPAVFHLVCGDLDRTADWAERAIEERQMAVLLFLNAHAQALRSSARWPHLAKMMNLPA